LATPLDIHNVMSGEGGGMADVWQFIDEIDADKQAMLVKRLEDRAQMPKFVAIRAGVRNQKPTAQRKRSPHDRGRNCGRHGTYSDWTQRGTSQHLPFAITG
jgi:hypothetical protein